LFYLALNLSNLYLSKWFLNLLISPAIFIMRVLYLTIYCLITLSVFSQEEMTADSQAVKTIDGITSELLKHISGGEKKERNWDAFRNLFLPGARFTILNHSTDIPLPFESASVDELIEALKDPYYENFLEEELHKDIHQYNGIAQVFQTFEATEPDGNKGRGINSYQLVFFDDRWWISNILWTTDANGVEIPSRYLGN
jgi:hypothetical protein